MFGTMYLSVLPNLLGLNCTELIEGLHGQDKRGGEGTFFVEDWAGAL